MESLQFMKTQEISITEEFKATINYFVNQCDTRRVDHILRTLTEQGMVDDEFGNIIYTENGDYIEEVDCLVLDTIETEIKNQLVRKFNE